MVWLGLCGMALYSNRYGPYSVTTLSTNYTFGYIIKVPRTVGNYENPTLTVTLYYLAIERLFFMKPNIKEKWINALRDGSYKQGRDRLKVNDTFCCLGVLTDLYIKEKQQYWETQADGLGCFEYNISILPDSVVNWAGLTNKSPEITTIGKNGIKRTTHLTTLNDSGCSFDEIANFIEKDTTL